MERGAIHCQVGLEPSPWVVQAVGRLNSAQTPGFSALDLACGGGRHSGFLAAKGYQVTAVDIKKPEKVFDGAVRYEQMDLEGQDWPLQGRRFDLVVVCNYLYRPRFPEILDLVKEEGGCLVYETFMKGNEQFGSPRNPDFLLMPGELLDLCGDLHVLAFEQGLRNRPTQAVIQRIVAMKGDWHAIQSRTNLIHEGHK